jgi:hypothetical protein
MGASVVYCITGTVGKGICLFSDFEFCRLSPLCVSLLSAGKLNTVLQVAWALGTGRYFLSQ